MHLLQQSPLDDVNFRPRRSIPEPKMAVDTYLCEVSSVNRIQTSHP